MPAAFGSGGHPLEMGNPIVLTWVYGDATPINSAFFVADRPYRVVKITGRSTIAGTDGGGVSATVNKAPSATALSGGTVLMSGSIDLKTTADTNFAAISLTATTADLSLAAGDAIGLVKTGTTTGARGVICVFLVPLA